MKDGTRTLVLRTAKNLERLSLAVAEGDFIGGEEGLLRQLGVSRPTLRQAAKIAENDRLVEVRRGMRGGFYASRPNAGDAVRMLARFLRLRGATFPQVLEVSRLVAGRAAELAAQCSDEALRARLAALSVRVEEVETRAQLIDHDHELASLISLMSGNPAIELVMATGYSFGMDEDASDLFRDPVEIREAAKLQKGIADAILAQEPDLALLMMRRRAVAIDRWLPSGSHAD